MELQGIIRSYRIIVWYTDSKSTKEVSLRFASLVGKVVKKIKTLPPLPSCILIEVLKKYHSALLR